MMAKVNVNGPKTSPVWRHLKDKFKGDVKWNFDTHFLVGRNGTVSGLLTSEKLHLY